MLHKLIDEILTAEAEAEQALKNAEDEARAVKLSTDAVLEKRREEFWQRQKSSRDKAFALAEKEAEIAYAAALKEAEREAVLLMRKDDKKTKKAVDLILENLK